MFLRLCLALFLFVAPLSQVSQAAAQGTGVLRISTPETNHFPTIQFRLDALDAEGNFIDFLQAADIQIQEDGQAVTPQTVEKVRNGLQVIVALNLSPAMAKKQNDITGYGVIQKALVDWVSSQPQSATNAPDDYSLATPTGLILIRESDPKLAANALAGYQPDLAHAQPALGSLAEALDLATDPLANTFMKRSILYITPALPASNNTTIADLTKRAQGIGVQINIWQVKGPQTGGEPVTNQFEQMAADTGGKFEEVDLATPLPEIGPLFQSLRTTYQVQYTSKIQKSGMHALSVQTKLAGSSLVSNENSFNLTVQPPNPIFLSPPASIQRYWSTPEKDAEAAGAEAAGAEAAGALPSLVPDVVTMQIMIEFPDQHHRALKATRLYVDGKLVVENTSEPFDRFSWSIKDVETASRQVLRAEAVDVLDLTGSSIELPIEVLVAQPAKAEIADSISVRGMIAIGAVAAAGLVLSLVLFLSNQQRRAHRKRQQTDKHLMNDPVTQPVKIQQDQPRTQKGQQPAAKPAATNPAGAKASGAHASSVWSNPIWPRKNGPAAPARLITLDENEQPITGGVILLTRQEITFGTDPQRATQVLNSPTVNDLHARLYRSTDGDFFLADQGSIAGTWINFAPITINGARLEHGDLIHIGRMMFRFELAQPTQAQIKVIDLEQMP